MIRCITIDDSPLALDLLDTYIGRSPGLERVDRFSNASEALAAIDRLQPDLIFLDIQMPDLTGIELLKKLRHKPKVVLTTAFPEYAIEGYDLDVSDYLLKPFSFERFTKAVEKVKQQLQSSPKTGDDVLYIKSGYDTVKVELADIEYIEALKDYIQVFTKEGKTLSLMSMKEIMKMLPAADFVRIHRSYIIPLHKISRISSRHVLIGKKEIPIGDIYKEDFQRTLKSKGIFR